MTTSMSNSAQKRRDQQIMSSSEQSRRDKEKFQSIIAAKNKAENRLFWLKCAGWALAVAAMVGGCSAMFAVDNRLAEERDAVVQAKYAKWVAYRDANCKVVEKLYGLSMASGKFSSNDNAVVYDCNGVKYMMSARAEENIKKHEGDEDFIPEVPKH
jgi:hypothetical protein